MGFDLTMAVMKRNVISKAKEQYPDVDFSTLYGNYLYQWIYNDMNDRCDIPDNEMGYYLVGANFDIFKGYFKEVPKSDEYLLIDEQQFKDMLIWLENKIKSTTLFDILKDNIESYYIEQMLNTYKCMKEAEIDFNTEIVVYDQG